MLYQPVKTGRASQGRWKRRHSGRCQRIPKDASRNIVAKTPVPLAVASRRNEAASRSCQRRVVHGRISRAEAKDGKPSRRRFRPPGLDKQPTAPPQPTLPLHAAHAPLYAGQPAPPLSMLLRRPPAPAPYRVAAVPAQQTIPVTSARTQPKPGRPASSREW